ncbi:MAG: ribosome biogenesis GTP-binding protein YihA/YsxC [Gammaproteobacteria bacterium]|nr:YihA family ribosome biogenesis GTP-binding protein [Gammaproteobacteria bacterium]
MAAKFLTSASSPGGFPRDEVPEVAFVGRSNSGKSSAINAITGDKKLARVSKTPGRTQLVNFFEVAPGRRVVDLPGYGFAKVAPSVREHWRGLIDAYLRRRPNLKGLCVTLDIRRGVTELDRTMLDWAESLRLPLLLLLTKADKVSRNEAARQRGGVQREAPPGSFIVVFSALTGQGVDEARAVLDRWFEGVTANASAGQKEAPGGNHGA